jgi:putative tryptophan/tyrosine transport system substrate-binding protein
MVWSQIWRDPAATLLDYRKQSTDLVGKRIELLRNVVPNLHRLAIMADVGYPGAVLEMREAQAAARALSIDVAPLEIRRAEDIAPAFTALRPTSDALYVVGDALVNANSTRIITLSLVARLPAMFYSRDFVQAGALMSYGPNYTGELRRAADLVDKILRGTKPGDIPVEEPTKFELVINLTTAKALGLTIPASYLSLADELIE